MTELSFLVSLLLDHKLPKLTQKAVADRIKEVEATMAPAAPSARPYSVQAAPTVIPAHLVGQSPSTIAAMMKHEAQGAPPLVPIPAAEAPAPVTAIAQTPAAQAALMERQQMIAAATLGGPFTGKPERGRNSPRKF